MTHRNFHIASSSEYPNTSETIQRTNFYDKPVCEFPCGFSGLNRSGRIFGIFRRRQWTSLNLRLDVFGVSLSSNF
ncbi:hypothetical protein QQG55_42290 [Brugia pahangi]